MLKICLQKSRIKNLFFIVFKNKHKIKERLGLYNLVTKKILLKTNKFIRLISNGVILSKTLFFIFKKYDYKKIYIV